MNSTEIFIRAGDIVHAPRWPEPVKVDLVEPYTIGYVRLVGVLMSSRTHVDEVLSIQEVSQLRPLRLEGQFHASPRRVFLGLEARRYRYASLYDPLLAMNISKVDPLPHQIEAVYGYILHQPRVRFLIADDPGAGKTIMAGLVIKEMKLRGLVRRILIVAPGHLKDQWQRELKERFDERFTLIDRQTMRNRFGENAWESEFQVITSLDFARQEDVMQALAGVHWDLTIVDEAHKMAAYKYGDKMEKTKRYRLGELLSRNSMHLLFLTATPHRGDPENFRLFLDLLQPGAFATVEMLDESIRSGDNPLFIRRLKEDLKDFEGRPLFLPRQVKTLTFNLGVESPAEKELYNALSHYVNEQYNKALASDRRRNVAFAMVILQRRLASSTYALYRSLERRKKRLEEMRHQADAFKEGRLTASMTTFSLDEVEDLSEEERWEQEALWETLSGAENRAELEAELQTLEQLLQQARAIIEQENEVKLRHFRQALHTLQEQDPGAKILIFTESRDTLEYLERRVRDWGYRVCTIHGGMPLEARIEAEKIFKNEAQMMVATEAAGEGINLQFCHLMINYDIPWNPNRLEQRMGRIHRYGQTHEVTIFNLVAVDTREGRVLHRLFEKLDEIRTALGSDRVFDVIDELFPGRDLARLLADAAANARTLEDILREIEIQVDETYLRQVRDKLGESLATRYIDYTRIREMNARARERRLIPEYTQAFFQRAWEHLGGEMRPRMDARHRGFFNLEKVPAPLRTLAEQDTFKKRFGILQKRYPLVTFDKELAMKESQAEFVSFGHPLFEAVLEWAEGSLGAELANGATFLDPDGQLDGVLLFYEGQIRDGLGQVAGKRLFSLFIPQGDGQPRAVDPAILWDLAAADSPASAESLDLEALKQQGQRWLLPHLEDYRQELTAERERQAQIKRKYGVESLRYLILELDNDLVRLQERALAGEDVTLAIHNKEQQKDAYLQALASLKKTLEQERQLTLETPRFLSAVRVLPMVAPLGTAGDEMHNDPTIEQTGMEIVLRYEREHGRQPQDVAAENLGYDVYSLDPQSGARRYIEVKARAGVGRVALTQNEWFTAQRLGEDYFLYVVMNAATVQPDLYIVRNPAAHLSPEEQREVRYLLPVEAIQSVAEHEEI
ncbi:MAG: helicase-related protein [Thermanaerothrix sp.]|uniref:helicase-related protein n=1 Tax=Thermanaerothrix sp. TaxID=2972675 RepID=UPI003C7C65B5